MTRVLALAGDGIGREVLPLAQALMSQAAEREGLGLEWIERSCGAAHFLATGAAIDAETIRLSTEVDAIFLGAVGLPDVRRPDGSEVADEVVLDLRSNLDLFANVRPVRSWPGIGGPLRRGDIAYTVVRENTEGLYASRVGGVVLRDQVATDTLVMTRSGVERVVRHAFELARASRGTPRDGRRLVTCVDKANTLRSFVFFRNIFYAVAEEFPDVAAECEHADAMSARMVLQPDTLNVLVCENMIGDILSDLAAATVGGLGLAPSANIGAAHAMFEPTHGSAPDIAGRGIANPVAAVLSGALLLRWIARQRAMAAAARAADRIEAAVEATLAEGIRTHDLGGRASTDAVMQRISENMRHGDQARA